MSNTTMQAYRVAIRDHLLSQSSITLLVNDRVHFHEWYSLHGRLQKFPMITILPDKGSTYLGLSSTFDIFIQGHSNKTYDEAHTVLQSVTDAIDPTIAWINTSFSLRGLSNPTEEYDIQSRIYTAKKRFRVNIVGI